MTDCNICGDTGDETLRGFYLCEECMDIMAGMVSLLIRWHKGLKSE